MEEGKRKLPAEVVIRVVPHSQHRYSTTGDCCEVGEGK